MKFCTEIDHNNTYTLDMCVNIAHQYLQKWQQYENLMLCQANLMFTECVLR